MDIKAYIESGILEQYVLGKLDPAEMLEVEQYARQYPEVKAEIEAIEEALEAYAQLHAVAPPAKVLDNVLDKIRETKPSPSSGSPPRRIHFWTPAWAALFFLASALGIWQYFKQEETSKQLASVQTTLENLEKQCAEVDASNQELQSQLLILKNPDFQPVRMKGTDLSPDALATVFYNSKDQKSYLDPINLPSPPSGKQYQLWAIVNGNPVDMGVITINPLRDSLIEVPFIATPAAFAVTLEQEGGSPTPTLDQMYVIGTI